MEAFVHRLRLQRQGKVANVVSVGTIQCHQSDAKDRQVGEAVQQILNVDECVTWKDHRVYEGAARQTISYDSAVLEGTSLHNS